MKLPFPSLARLAAWVGAGLGLLLLAGLCWLARHPLPLLDTLPGDGVAGIAFSPLGRDREGVEDIAFSPMGRDREGAEGIAFSPMGRDREGAEGIAFSPMVLDRDGALLRLGLTPDHKYRLRTRLRDIAPAAVQATLHYEDRWFYLHPGVNPFSLLRAGWALLTGQRRVGGSTITMQVARLRLNLTTTTFSGKLRQMLAALQLTWHYSKDEILEAYFNLAPYGGNIEGIGAAARIYFHRPPAQLTPTESLALAVVPQNPEKRSPLHGKEFDAARARLSQSAGERAPLQVFGPDSLPFAAPHVSTEAMARHPGVTRTTIDSGLQRLLETGLQRFAGRGQAYGIRNAAALLLHWPSMEVRALAGSANFHDARIAGQVDGTRARRSPGSTLKPFIYALALDQGLIHPQTVLLDTPQSFRGYNPENFDRSFRGPLPAHAALRASRNIPAIWLASKLRPDLYSWLQRAEVNLPFSERHYGLSLVLGGAEVTMRELADLYAMLPNKGVWRQARLFQDAPQRPARPLLSPEAALVTLFMLEDPTLGLRTRQGFIPLRCKTGTSNGFRDAWTAGVAGPYVLVVWVGNFDNAPNPLLVGGEVALPLFEDLFRAIHLREPFSDLIPKQAQGLNLRKIPTCTATGDVDTSLCPDTTPTWYIPGRSPSASSGVYRRILVDTASGLRDCLPSPEAQEQVWEFWPTELQAMFARAGLDKPAPPPFLPRCRPESSDSVVPRGTPPNIVSPVEGIVYLREVREVREVRSGVGATGAQDTQGGQNVPLIAGVDADARTVFWFLDERFVGQSAPGNPLFIHPEAGEHRLRAVDDLGRVSQRRLTVIVK